MIFPVKTTKKRTIMYVDSRNAFEALQSVAKMLSKQSGKRSPGIRDADGFLYFVFNGETYSVLKEKRPEGK